MNPTTLVGGLLSSPSVSSRSSEPAVSLLAGTVSMAILFFCGTTTADTYSLEAMLHGAPEATSVSGFKGSSFRLEGPGELHAVYGLFSVERKDHPCYVGLRTEDINDYGSDSGDYKDLCGKRGTSSELGAAYEDTGSNGTRVFVHGVRVCMNKKGTRVKGLQLRGKRIDENGHPVDLESGDPTHGQAGGSDVGLHVITEPRDTRAHCNNWKRWSECPRHNQIATAVIAHFEAGNTPRSLTGLALECRYASRKYVVQ